MAHLPSDPRPLAAASLQRAIAETSALGLADVARSLEALLAGLCDSSEGLRIETVAGRVLRGGCPIVLSNRELELVLALAVHDRPLGREVLAELVFPDDDLDVALNRIKVYIHRVRDKVAPDFITCTRQGYRLRAGVTIDVEEFANTVDLLAAQPFLSAQNRAMLRGILASFHGARHTASSRWEWYAKVERRIANIAARATERLAADAFERKATGELLELAGALVHADPCDEQGREIAIKAHIAAGRADAARAEYHHYEIAVRRELGGRPSVHLRELLETA